MDHIYLTQQANNCAIIDTDTESDKNQQQKTLQCSGKVVNGFGSGK